MVTLITRNRCIKIKTKPQDSILAAYTGHTSNTEENYSRDQPVRRIVNKRNIIQ